ncbi:MAG: PIN domain-containing protein, partial [Pseudonocardiales bacterium]
MALTCLLDTSVWNRLDRAPALAAKVTTLLRRSEVGYSDIERLEVLRSARHTEHYRRLSAMFAALPKIPLTETALARAGQVQEQLVQRGHHRGVKIPDLLIAAAAEEAAVRVLHYD